MPPPPPPSPRPVLARTTSVDETRALGSAVAEVLRPGDIVVLSGEMGAGKTAFTQGVGDGLGVDDRVTSPTFTIAQTYEGGRLSVHHLDVYRLEHLHEALDIGLAEILDDGAVVVIEWGDAVLGVLPADYLEVRITFAPLPASRDEIDPASPELGAEGHTRGRSTAPSSAGGSDRGGADGGGGDDDRRWMMRPVGSGWTARSDGLRAKLAPWAETSC